MSSYEKHLNPIFRNLSQIADFSDMVAKYTTLRSEEFPPFKHLEGLSVKALKYSKTEDGCAGN
jgi:hypothetical protein